MAAKETPPNRTAKAALGEPDKEHGWHLAHLFVPYLSFSSRELDDLMDLNVEEVEFSALPEEVKARDYAQQLRALRQLRAATYARLLRRRMGEGAVTAEELYDRLDAPDLEAWRARTASGGLDPKAEAAADSGSSPT